MTDITNDGATAPANNTYNICNISGFRAKPGELVRRWDGMMVLPEFTEQRHPQDFTQAIPAEKHDGSVSPESSDNFITTAISADDL